MTVPRYVKPGEMLAMRPGSMYQDRKGFFWMMGSGPLPNERRGDVMIVHVRGELEHHASDTMGCAESYEGLREKMSWAIRGQVDGDSDADDAGGPPKAIVMVIDSPGGVVSGLNETVKAIRKMIKDSGIPTIAYCDEMAASAAYAIACSCERIIAPESAIVGSIGVISTMVSQARKDAKDGYDVRLLTSGARKADGHPHAPLSDKAVDVEMQRVSKLAEAFFALASKARGIPVGGVRNLEAGIFLGKDAKRVKLVDEVRSFDDVIAEASGEQSTAAPKAGGNQTDRRLKMDLKTLITKTEAAIAKEKDPKKIAALLADLSAYKRTHAAYKKTEKYVEETVKEEETAEDEGEDEKAAASEEEEAASDEDEKAELPDDEDDEDDDTDEKSSKASLAFRAAVEELTGMKGKKALGAIRAIAAGYQAMAKDVAALKAQTSKNAKASLIAGARGKYLTPKEAAWLATQPMATVKGFVEMRRNSGVIVNTDETTLAKPKHVEPGTEEALPADTIKAIDQAVAGWQGDKKAYRAALVSAQLELQKKQGSEALNGAGRY